MSNMWQGKLVKLRAVEPDDWQQFFAWDEDTEYGRYTWQIPFPRSREATQKWTTEQAAAKPQNDEFRLCIETLNGQFVGTINTHDCDPRVGTFEYGIVIDRQHQRHGYATEAVQLVLTYFFKELRYQKVSVIVYDFNVESLALHEKLGFQHEGRLRRMGFSNGRYFDYILLGLTKEEFEERQQTN